MCMGGGSVPNAPNTSAQSTNLAAIGTQATQAGAGSAAANQSTGATLGMADGGGSVPNAPNTSAQSTNSAAIGTQAAQAGTDQLNWAKGQTGANTATNTGVQSQLTPMIGSQAGAGSAAANQFTGTTLGGLNQQLQTAQAYGSPAGMAQASAAAAAQTGQAYDAARLNNQRQLGSYGVDPSTMKSGALNLNANLQQAGAVGNAAYNAGQARQQAGMAATSSALGQNLQAAGVGQGFNAGANQTGSTVANIGNQTLGANSAALSAPSQMFNTGLSGDSTSANIQNQQFANQMTSYNANQANSNSLMSGIGTLAGTAMKAYTGGMADGGVAIPRRFDNGGYAAGAGMVPLAGSGVAPVMQGARYQAAPSGAESLASGFDKGQNMGADMAGAYNAYQANHMRPATEAASSGVKDQFLQQPVNMPAPPSGSLPAGYANGGIPQRGMPPTVNMPGPWTAANGGQSPPGFIDPSRGPTDGTGIDDQVPAKLSVGEFIVPADVVHAKGKEFFDKLLSRYHTPAQVQRQQMGMR